MPNWLVVILFAIGAVAFFGIALSITLITKGHHIESEISTNPNMKKLGIKCAVQETREDIAAENCDIDSVCTGNCAGCDIDHSIANK
jgi:hypothetical protein